MTTWIVLLAVGFLALSYVYGGYALLLMLWVRIRRAKGRPSTDHESDTIKLPGVTVYFSAYNEESKVIARLENLAAQDHPQDRFEVLVISDGSSDRTAELARSFAADRPTLSIRVHEFSANRGRAAAQNWAADNARFDVLLATDADTRFGPETVRRIAARFRDPKVGVVGGVLRFPNDETAISRDISMYWRMELLLRRLEDQLGLTVKTGGPCTAYRREVWNPIRDFEDIDQVVTLLARKKQYVAVQAADAPAYDYANETARQELRSRSRMTRKAILSIRNQWGIGDLVRYPQFSFVLISHKLVRFCSPVFLALFLLGGFGVLAQTAGALVTVGLIGVAGIGGLLGARMASHTIFGRAVSAGASFALANAGFALGLWGWIRQDRSGSYKPTHMRK